MARPFRFGVQVSALEPGSWRQQLQHWESQGFSSVFWPDHFGKQWEPVAALAAAASFNLRQRTSMAEFLARGQELSSTSPDLRLMAVLGALLDYLQSLGPAEDPAQRLFLRPSLFHHSRAAAVDAFEAVEDRIERSMLELEQAIAVGLHVQGDLISVLGLLAQRRQHQELMDVAGEPLHVEALLFHSGLPLKIISSLYISTLLINGKRAVGSSAPADVDSGNAAPRGGRLAGGLLVGG